MPSAPGKRSRVFLLGAACLQNASTGGLLFGYSALKPSIEKINCGNVDVGQVFTFSMSANMFAPLLLAGPILDLFGPRVCSCLSTGLVGLGFLLFGVSSHLPGCSGSYFLPAILLIGIGGPGCQCSLFHTANLFQRRGIALNCITCCIGLSFVVFQSLVAWSDGQGLDLQTAFLFYSILPLLFMVVGFFTMPDTPYERSEVFAETSAPSNPVTFTQALPSSLLIEGPNALNTSSVVSFGAARPMMFIRRKRTGHRDLRAGDSFVVGDQQQQEPAASSTVLRNQLCSPAFVELVLIFVLTSFFANVFLGNMPDIAEAAYKAGSRSDASDASAVAADYVAMFFRFSPLSGFVNPMLGFLIDHFGVQLMLITILTVGFGYALALYAGSFLVGAVLFSIFSTSYFAYTYSFLAFEFGFEYYGLLAGVVQAVGSIVLLTVLPCVRQAATAHGWLQIQLVQVIAFVAFSLLLVCSRLTRRCLRNRQAAQPQPTNILSLQPRCYSEGDLHTIDGEAACRRRPGFFPSADDILIRDGAHSHHSHKAYKFDSPTSKTLAPLTESPESFNSGANSPS